MRDAPPLPELDAPDALTERQKWRLLAVLWVCFWVLMLVIAVQDHLHNPAVLWWEPLLWEGSSALIATAWLIVQLRLARRARRVLHRPITWFIRHLKWFPLVALGFIAAIYSIRHAVYAVVGVPYQHAAWTFVLLEDTAKIWLFLGLWLGIIFALESFSMWQEGRHRLAVLQKSLAEAQLGQLKAQLRPHFLFNALNTISSLMHVDVARADRLLTHVAELLRASLRLDQEELTSLAAELHIARLYARIMQERFADRVSLEWRIEPEAQNASVPTMILQPLLENAFKHGVEHTSVPATILVAAKRVGDALEIRITNSGEVSPMPGAGVGLRNCRARLSAHFGEAARLELRSDEKEAEVCLRVPWQERPA
ncbi:MAG: histidine kinase [Gammaproteobacteria bacterium]|nr:sensor histidine kinase [Gammaproteobacteria bacterium]